MAMYSYPESLMKMNQEAGLEPNQRALNKYLPQYKSFQDESGNLKSQYQVGAPPPVQWTDATARTLDPNQYAANTTALDAMRTRALATGDSPWANLQLQTVAREQSQTQDLLGQQSRGQTQQGMSDLAMRGGLSSGARERMARGGTQDMNRGYQGLSNAAAGQRLGIRTADEEQKMRMLSQIPGLDLGFANQRAGLEQWNLGQQTQADQFNKMGGMQAGQFYSDQQMRANALNQGAALGGTGSENAFNMDVFQQRMMAEAANRQADALAQGLGGGGKAGRAQNDYLNRFGDSVSQGAGNLWQSLASPLGTGKNWKNPILGG